MRSRKPLPEDADGADLGGQAVRGGVVTAGAQGAKFILNAAGIMIMARLLVPEDFGLVAMVLPLVDLIVLFQDFGLSAATVQRKSITPAQSSNLFWFNVAASLVLALTVAALSPLVAAFYGDQRLIWVTIAFGGLVLCSGLTAQHLALLTRHMRFSQLAKQDVSALAIGLTAGAVGAWYGMGYWALVLSMACRSVVLLILVWLATDWWPERPSRRSGVRPLLQFGRDLTLVRLGSFLIENLDSVLVGKAWGGHALGLYDRAYSLLRIYKQVNGPVNTVATSVLSRLQHDPDRFRHYYVRGLGLVTGFSMPLIAFLAANATDVVRVALGEKWLAAVPIFLALAPATFIGTVKCATTWVYTSLGRTDRQLKWYVFVQLPVTLGAYFIGLPFGPVGVAAAFSIVSVALRLPSIMFCLHDFKAFLRLGDVLGAMMPAAFASLTAAAFAVILKHALLPDGLGPVAAIAVDLAVFGALYLVIYCALPIGRRNVATYVRIIARAFDLPTWTSRFKRA